MTSELIMTIEATATYLQLNPLTVRRLARDGLIPVMKLGRQWRTRRDVLDRWIVEQSVKNVVLPFPNILDTATG